MPRLAALLAAGAGTRYAGPTHKLQAMLQSRPVWEWSLHRALGAGFDHVVLVTGAVDLVVPAAVSDRVIVRHNPDWADGQATSVRVATATAGELGATSVTIGLADQPFVTADAWRAVSTAHDDCRIVVATYDGRPGPHPVRLAAEVWPLLPDRGDHGARDLLGLHPEWVCRVPCIGSVDDIDTVEDLARWKSC
ncbi:MAG: nucleotidyltransferase family protein [Ilumatobacteraceae bacterium]